MSSMLITEIALRGAATGASVLMLGLIFVSPAPRIRRFLGALFLWGVGVYILLSANDQIELLGSIAPYFKIFAIYNSVFFWWFALSLFDDDYRLDWLKIWPVFLIAFFHAPLPVWGTALGSQAERIFHSAFSACLMGHAVWVALKNRSDDLVDPRRRFRLVFAVSVGLVGMFIAVVEGLDSVKALPQSITLIHAILLAVLTFFFAFWMFSANSAFFAIEEIGPAPENQAVGPRLVVLASDAPAFKSLMALMDSGGYRQEGLTVAKLAEKVGVPEHQLRRLINQELGFRNFSVFLNSRRVEDAKLRLTDPVRAREQVIQIALELGYGSIAPFNRAFKAATGMTPTEFRRAGVETKQFETEKP